MIIWVVCVLVVGVLAFVRLAPSDAGRWHLPVEASEDSTRAGGAVRIIDGDMKKFMQLSDIASNTARSVVLAGSASDGMMTFVTRSKWIGFPDYTTIQLDGDKIKLHARLRFGRSDLGVNAARLERWIDQLNRG